MTGHAAFRFPGGVLAAVDFDLGGCRTRPEVELYSRVIGWVIAGYRHAQSDPLVGMRLPVMFTQLGLDDVGSMGIQNYRLAEHRHALALVVGVVRSLMDAIVASGVVTEKELDIDTLEQRLVVAMSSAKAVFTWPTS